MSASSIVKVDLAGRAYDIAIGPGLIDRVGELSARLLAAPRVIIVTDDTVAPLYGARLTASFKNAGIDALEQPIAHIKCLTAQQFLGNAGP